jgi:hypothetical protein
MVNYYIDLNRIFLLIFPYLMKFLLCLYGYSLRCKCRQCFTMNRGTEKWEAVTDPISGLVYWWNKFTNETTALGAAKPESGTVFGSGAIYASTTRHEQDNDVKKMNDTSIMACLACTNTTDV